MDRVDIIIEVPAVKFEHLSKRIEEEPSANIKKRVDEARQIQNDRFGTDGNMCNARMGPDELRRYCELDRESMDLMKQAFDVFSLTARSYDKIIKVARTIADLAGSVNITSDHIAEAIQFRMVNI